MRGRKKDTRKFPVGPIKKGQDEQILEALGETVKRLRKCARISQERIAELLGLHQTAVCRVELGLQSLQPWHLQKICELYGIGVAALLSGQVNYWNVAERFGQTPPYPKRYLELVYAKVREFIPLLQFMSNQKGQAFTQRALNEFDLDFNYLRGPDQPIGVNCNLDLMRQAIQGGILNDGTLKALVDEARTETAQGFLYQLYQSQSSPMNLVKTYVLNSHHYESNFTHTLLESSEKGVVLSVKPSDHMSYVKYKDEVLGDVLCRYRREFLSQLPSCIDATPFTVSEKECHFHGADRCLYTISA